MKTKFKTLSEYHQNVECGRSSKDTDLGVPSDFQGTLKKKKTHKPKQTL